MFDLKQFLTENKITMEAFPIGQGDLGARVAKTKMDADAKKDFMQWSIKNLNNPAEQEFGVQYLEWAASGVGGGFRPEGKAAQLPPADQKRLKDRMDGFLVLYGLDY